MLVVAFEPTKAMVVGYSSVVEVLAAQNTVPPSETIQGNPATSTAVFSHAHCELHAELFGTGFDIRDDTNNTQSFLDASATFRFRWQATPTARDANQLRVVISAKGISGIAGAPWTATVTIKVNAAPKPPFWTRFIRRVKRAWQLIIGAIGLAIVALMAGVVVGDKEHPGLLVRSAYRIVRKKLPGTPDPPRPPKADADDPTAP